MPDGCLVGLPILDTLLLRPNVGQPLRVGNIPMAPQVVVLLHVHTSLFGNFLSLGPSDAVRAVGTFPSNEASSPRSSSHLYNRGSHAATWAALTSMSSAAVFGSDAFVLRLVFGQLHEGTQCAPKDAIIRNGALFADGLSGGLGGWRLLAML